MAADSYDSGQDNQMSDLYQGSMGNDEGADTEKDTSGDDETVDEQDQEAMAKSSVVPMSMLKAPDGKPVKAGDVIEVKAMKIFGGTDVQICRADQYKDDNEPGEGTKEEEMSPDEEIDSLSTRM